MEQMYLIEIFVDKVTVFQSEEADKSGAKKNLIVKIKFGPNVQFIIKEGQLAVNKDIKDDIVECDERGQRKWSRTIRVGKSYLFPSYPDTMLMILSKFPLEIEVWNDDENEIDIFVGVGTMHWDTQFFHMLKESAKACKLHEPLSIKQSTPIYAECCCKQCGEVSFILRLSALGKSIETEFQQLMYDPDSFVFRTDKAPSMFQCKRVEGDDPNFCMTGSIYETATLEDPDIINKARNKIEVCTELQSCGMGQKDTNHKCAHDQADDDNDKKKYTIEKIRMGDIVGPCGNANCALAHKVRTYIRSLDAYKKETQGKITESKVDVSKKVCGTCSCKDDKWHRDSCLEKQNQQVECTGCGGSTKVGETCKDKNQKLYGTGTTPKQSKTTISYFLTENLFPTSDDFTYGRNFIVENCIPNYKFQQEVSNYASSSRSVRPSGGCCCRSKPIEDASCLEKVITIASMPNFNLRAETYASSLAAGVHTPKVYNAEVKNSNKINAFCTDIPTDKDCKCSPPKPTPPCKTFDCDCITEAGNIFARKHHKPYCPSYKHKDDCPVNIINEDEENKKHEDEEDETEPLPYGLPPVKLGPCPVLGKPCTYPDGFARMYKVAAQPAPPPSYSDAGKVCCSKEFERIKKAIKEYMKYEKDHDYRCINQFNVDTERRCCDKEQRLMALTGKGCCGSHKLAIQEKYKEDKF